MKSSLGFIFVVTVIIGLASAAVSSVNHPNACKPDANANNIPENKQPEEVLWCPTTWGAITYLTLALVVIGGIQTVVFGVQASKLAETIDTMRAISQDQSRDVERSINESERAASAMEDVALAMNEQRKLMHGQQEIMASQRDISFVTQRAWVSAVVQIDRSITVANGQVSGFFTLKLTNTGSLPAYVDRTFTMGYPWSNDPGHNDSNHATWQINRHTSERVGSMLSSHNRAANSLFKSLLEELRLTVR